MTKNRSFASIFLLTTMSIIMLVFLCACSNSGSQNNITPASLDDFKEAAMKYGLGSKLEPLMSEDNKLIAYSIKNGSDSQPSNLIFYDVKKEENIDQVYSTCVNSVKHLSSLENISADVTEGADGNYEYIKATDFKSDDKYSMDLPIQLSYAIRVGCTCLYMDAYPAEYEAYTSVANELGYMI